MAKYGWVAALLFGLSLLGCSDQPSTYPVSGTVTFDGQPVPDGDIVFRDDENKIAPDAGKIKDGTFAFRSTQGKKKVDIQAYRLKNPSPEMKQPTGAPPPPRGSKAPANYIPKRYNTETKLTAEVTASGPNQYEFKLTSP